MNKSLLIVAFLLVTGIFLHGQIGLELTYHNYDYKDWNKVLYDKTGQEIRIFNKAYGAGVNYWFSTKRYRIEFTPGVFYQYSSSTIKPDKDSYVFQSHTAGAEFDVNMYIFDFIRRNYERDCPSFSNSKEWFREGFFIQVSPGIFSVFRNTDMTGSLTKSHVEGKFDIGAGLDFSLGTHLGMAPVLKYGFLISAAWDGFAENFGNKVYYDKTAASYYSLTLSFYVK